MAKAVLVVDMVRGFCEEGNPLYTGESARRIIPTLRRLLEGEAEAGSKIIFICDNHEPDDLEFQMFPKHCVVGTRETEIVPELADIEGEVIPKQRYSGFFNTDLADRLERLAPDKIIVCGVCTDICVMHTVADARNRDYPVEVPADCVATHTEETQRFALDHIQRILGAKVIQTETAV
ncbi:MAG: cysteine hydrolase family protein [Dehalococcoidia bacterium]